MSVQLQKLPIPLSDQERQDLVFFLSTHDWPFHGQRRLSAGEVERKLDQGFFCSSEAESFWIVTAAGDKLGLIRLFDLEDETPLFDLRLAPAARGMGYGTQALRLLCQEVFALRGKKRFEGYTRADNRGMIRVFQKCGFRKEAHHRASWPDEQGRVHDSVGYTLLRAEWEAPEALGPSQRELIQRAAAVIRAHRTPGGLIGDVGCALISASGQLYLGVCAAVGSNIFCAEQAAIGAMLTAGETRIHKIVAVWKDEAGQLFVIPPCGNCRQLLREVDAVNLETEVVLDADKTVLLRELLPYHHWWQPQ